VAIKFSLEGIPPFMGAGLRFLIAVPLLYGYARLRGVSLALTREVYWLVVATAILVYGVDYGLVYWSEQYLSAGVTAILFATFPFFTGLFSHFVTRTETLGVNICLGLLLGFVGVGATFYRDLFDEVPEGTVFWATLAVLMSAAAGALATVLTKKHLSVVRPVSLTLNQMLVGALLLLLVAFSREEFGQATWGARTLLGLVYLGSIASALAFTLYYWLLQRMSAITLSSMIYILPLVAVGTEWLVYGEVLTLQAMLGMVLIFLGIAVAELPKYRSQLSGVLAERWGRS
jgi:drug/metabolite transporter (DMT)-like permease